MHNQKLHFYNLNVFIYSAETFHENDHLFQCPTSASKDR